MKKPIIFSILFLLTLRYPSLGRVFVIKKILKVLFHYQINSSYPLLDSNQPVWQEERRSRMNLSSRNTVAEWV